VNDISCNINALYIIHYIQECFIPQQNTALKCILNSLFTQQFELLAENFCIKEEMQKNVRNLQLITIKSSKLKITFI